MWHLVLILFSGVIYGFSGSPPLAPLALGAAMQQMEAAVKETILPADNSAVESAILDEGLQSTENQIVSAQGDSLLDRIVRTLVESRLDAHFFTGMCPRNYTVPCPRGYTDNGGTCIADQPDESLPAECATYSGNGAASMRPEEFSKRCQVQWPCAACTRSFKNCPAKFQNTDTGITGVCVPTRGYIGPCKGEYDFRDSKKFTNLDKARWAASCYTNWPCDPE